VSEIFDAAGLEQLVAEARRAVRAIRAGERPPGEELQGTGEAADGAVRAVVGPPGRVLSLDIDPRLLRRGSTEIADAVTQAVNAALDQLRTTASAAVVPADLDRLERDLEAVQLDSVRQMATLGAAMETAMAQLRSRRA
jgi:DNA-binding protein YbaB